MPITIAPIDWQDNFVFVELFLKCGHHGADLTIDWADAIKMIIVLGDFEHPLSRHVTTSQNVFQKRHHVVPLFGTTETDDEYGVVHDCVESIPGLLKRSVQLSQ